MVNKIKVSVVSYLNSQVFIRGLEGNVISNEIDLFKDIPSVCAQRLISEEADIGLVPVAVIPLLPNHKIITNTCIGAVGKVNSVMLYSQVPLAEIETIMLDFHSRTSVTLVQVLAANYWHIHPQYVRAQDNFISLINGTSAAVIIGDRTFSIGNTYKYSYDLSEAWQSFTNLPFVFACWVAKKNISNLFIEKFEQALQEGLLQKNEVIQAYNHLNNDYFNVKNYLENNIQYQLDDEKIKGLNLFLSLMKDSKIYAPA
jgi:chorismate dehydratase